MQVGQQMARLPIVETNIVWPEKEFQKWSTKQEKKEKKPEKEDLKVEHKTGEKGEKAGKRRFKSGAQNRRKGKKRWIKFTANSNQTNSFESVVKKTSVLNIQHSNKKIFRFEIIVY